MAIVAYNQTTGSLLFTELSIPHGAISPSGSSGSVILTDFNEIYEIQADDELRNYVTASQILLDVGAGLLSLSESLALLDAATGSTFGNNFINTGSGQGIFKNKNILTVNLRSLTASGSVSIVSGTNEINISSSAVLSGSNTGSGVDFLDGLQGTNLVFRRVSGSGAITVTSQSGTIIVSANSSSGEANTASNLGSGQGVFAQKAGVDLQFRSLTASGSVSIVSGSTTINVSSSAVLSGSNTGSGIGTLEGLQGTNLIFRGISGSGGTTVTSGTSGTILVSSSIGEVNIASNIGSGEGVFQNKVNVTLQFRSLTASGSVSLVSSSNTINISSSAVLSGSVTGSGIGVFEGLQGTNLVFRSLSGSGAVSVTSGSSGTIVFSGTVGEIATASNTGSGEGVFQNKVGANFKFRSITGSGSLSVVSGTTTINISSSAVMSGSNTGSGAGVFESLQNTNLIFRSISGSGGISVSSSVGGTIVVSGSSNITNVTTNLKEPAKFATTGAVSLSGTGSVDSSGSLSKYNVTIGDRILVKNQVTSSQNGVYLAATGSWIRTLDYDEGGELTDGTSVWVSNGYRQRSSQWMLTTDGTASVVVGTTPLRYTQNSSIENVEIIPFPETRTAGNSTRVGQTTFEGGSYFLFQPVRFNKILMKLTNTTNIPFIIMQIFQAANGNAGQVRRVATVSSSFAAQGDFALATQEGEVTLEQGIFYILWGKANPSPNALTMRTYSVQALDYVNQNMPVGVHPATFTTAFNVDMNTTSFDPVSQVTASTLDIVPIIRFLNS